MTINDINNTAEMNTAQLDTQEMADINDMTGNSCQHRYNLRH